jgi:PPM family protein phosphatase
LGSAVIHYNSAGLSDRGRKRSTNEDAFAVSPEHGVYVVCDGMGGAAAGEVASSVAVEEMVKHLQARTPETPLPQAAEQAIRAANEAIYGLAQHNSKLSGMGTTLVALVAEENRAWVLNVGDSRGYRFRAGTLEQITIDHSLVDEQVRAGRMNSEEAKRSPLRNVITRALGTQSSVTPDVFPLDTEPGDLFLLCSDGLTRELSDDLLASMLANDLPIGELCERLIGAANKAGGNDNITCLLIRAEA